MAVGNAVLDVVLAPGFLEHVNKIANYLRQQLAGVVDRNRSVVEDVRGQGLLMGIKCKVPNGQLIDALRERGLLTVAAGDNVVRILPPMIATEEHVREAISILNDACQSLAHVPATDAAK
jgi:acetylornithine/N-succinyldiaminopimelate aminotransferase